MIAFLPVSPGLLALASTWAGQAHSTTPEAGFWPWRHGGAPILPIDVPAGRDLALRRIAELAPMAVSFGAPSLCFAPAHDGAGRGDDRPAVWFLIGDDGEAAAFIDPDDAVDGGTEVTIPGLGLVAPTDIRGAVIRILTVLEAL